MRIAIGRSSKLATEPRLGGGLTTARIRIVRSDGMTPEEFLALYEITQPPQKSLAA